MIPTLSGPVGRLYKGVKPKTPPAGNNASDVLIVQRLLNKVACEPKLPEDGNATDDLISAIEDFQSSWTTGDGKVDPGGTTLRRLDHLATGDWTLQPVTKKKVEKGGYVISLGPSAFNWKRKYTMYVTLHNSTLGPTNDLRQLAELPYCLDVSDRPTTDLLRYEDLSSLLKGIEAFGDAAWGNERHCAVYVARGDVIVNRSRNSVPLTCPVKPLPGKPDVIMPESLPYRHGPLVTPTPINEKYWFRESGLFFTDNERRGLDCCTYPSAVYGLTSGTDCGANIAKAIAPGNANDVDNEDYDAMMTFLTSHRTGRYLMWYDYGADGHVVLVVDGTAHEWSSSAQGYKATTVPATYKNTDALIWGNRNDAKFWVRKL